MCWEDNAEKWEKAQKRATKVISGRREYLDLKLKGYMTLMQPKEWVNSRVSGTSQTLIAKGSHSLQKF